MVAVTFRIRLHVRAHLHPASWLSLFLSICITRGRTPMITTLPEPAWLPCTASPLRELGDEERLPASPAHVRYIYPVALFHFHAVPPPTIFSSPTPAHPVPCPFSPSSSDDYHDSQDRICFSSSLPRPKRRSGCCSTSHHDRGDGRAGSTKNLVYELLALMLSYAAVAWSRNWALGPDRVSGMV